MRIALVLLFTASLAAQDSAYSPQNEQIPGPQSPSGFAAWLRDIQNWRHERLIRVGYDGSQYERPELKWSQSSFIQPQMMIEDRYFYDAAAGKYTVDRYLDDLEKRYGGIDSVLIWHTYPNIGLDDRNQNDLLHDMPGGLAGVRQMIADFHLRGVRVLFPIMLWDQGTRDLGAPNWEATAKLFAEIGADGLNGDTLRGVPRAFRESSDRVGHPLVLEPESGLDSDEMLAWNNMTWGYWNYAEIPTVSRYKWLEPRHMVNICRRWARDKTDDLQHAFFNGIGYESWENIWGIWNQLSDRDAEALRRIAKIERRFAGALISPQWEPHTPVLRPGIYASKFPAATLTLWTFVNRNEFDVGGMQIQVPYERNARYFDVWNGVELKPELRGGQAVLSFPIEAHGYGAVVTSASADLDQFLAEMKALAKTPLSSFSPQRRVLPQQLVEIAPAPRKVIHRAGGHDSVPGGAFRFRISGIEIEGKNEIGVDVEYPWENSPRRDHDHAMNLAPYYIDRYPVTNEQFKMFLEAARYHPTDDHNFLRDWNHGSYPQGGANRPVTWVSLEDARAYAAWAGKRLPHEWEWQYAAQGADGRLYPWGDTWDTAAVPQAGIQAARCVRRRMCARIRSARVHSAWKIWLAMCGNGRMSTLTIIRAPQSYAAAATISRRARIGIFRRVISWTSMENIC